MKIRIYSEEAAGSIEFNDFIRPLPDADVLNADSGIVWTESQAGGPLDHADDILIINTKPTRFTFAAPKMVRIVGRRIVMTAVSERDASGTVSGIKRFYIVLEM